MKIIEPKSFTDKFEKLFPPQVKNVFKKKIAELKDNPTKGRPLSYVFIRELKSKGYRVYYVIYDEKVILVDCGNKKTQEVPEDIAAAGGDCVFTFDNLQDTYTLEDQVNGKLYIDCPDEKSSDGWLVVGKYSQGEHYMSSQMVYGKKLVAPYAQTIRAFSAGKGSGGSGYTSFREPGEYTIEVFAYDCAAIKANPEVNTLCDDEPRFIQRVEDLWENLEPYKELRQTIIVVAENQTAS
ncbi:type II toxin-antitoxin system RelE/ParE family toxin [Candidatus Woesearchaeota archaeon]|nr:type II toxin-antitoxin system RelE/ParE family toxin [Candidatus Woesearchaeota archaeon]